jgi:cyanophycin synthetase
VVGIAGQVDAALIARQLAWLLQLSGRQTGLACREGLFFGERCVVDGDATGGALAQRLLINREIEAAVFQNDALSILEQGLVYDRCAVGVVTDLGGADTLAAHDIQEAGQLPKVLRTQIDIVLGDGVGVLNADDARIAALAEHCDGEVLLYATQAEALAAHREAGGRAVLWRDGRPLLIDGSTQTALAVPARHAAMAPSSLLAITAAAWACGLTPALIAAGLSTYLPRT